MDKVHTMVYFKLLITKQKHLTEGGGGGSGEVKTAEGEDIKMLISDKLQTAQRIRI